MNSHLPLVLLLLMFQASSSVDLVFHVQNKFLSENLVRLKVVDDSRHVIAAAAQVSFEERHTWEVSMKRYRKSLTYLCHVTEIQKSNGEETYLGFFTAFSGVWIKETFSSLQREKTIQVLWYVFDVGAITKLEPEMGGNLISHRWLKITFVVMNDFNETVELSALNGADSVVVKKQVAKGKTLSWTRFVTSKTRHFIYKCGVSDIVGREEIGKVVIFRSSSVDFADLEESGAFDFWWAANKTGIRNYSPITGKYSKKEIRWTPNDMEITRYVYEFTGCEMKCRDDDETESDEEDDETERQKTTDKN